MSMYYKKNVLCLVTLLCILAGNALIGIKAYAEESAINSSGGMSVDQKPAIRDLLLADNFEAALQGLSELINSTKNFPNGVRYWELVNAKIYCLLVLGRNMEASEFTYELTKTFDDDPKWFILRGIVDCFNDNYALAIKSFSDYLNITDSPSFNSVSDIATKFNIYSYRMWLYAQTGQRDKCLDDINSLKNLRNQVSIEGITIKDIRFFPDEQFEKFIEIVDDPNLIIYCEKIIHSPKNNGQSVYIEFEIGWEIAKKMVSPLSLSTDCPQPGK